MKAKLVSVCPAALNGLMHRPMPRQVTMFKRRQMPLVIEDNITVMSVLSFSCIDGFVGLG